jgi:hypothetical protein
MVRPKHDAPPRDLEADSLLLPGDDGELAAGGAAGGPASGSLRARHRPGLLGPSGLLQLPETPPLDAAVNAFKAEEEERNPITDGDFPLRALAQGLSMLSLDELRRLHLPTLPWQTGDESHPGMLSTLRKKPWKAHYTSLVGFLISTGESTGRAACVLCSRTGRGCPQRGCLGLCAPRAPAQNQWLHCPPWPGLDALPRRTHGHGTHAARGWRDQGR